MTRTPPAGPATPRPWWLGLAVLAAGGAWLYGALALPQTVRYAVVGPGIFPLLVGAGLVVLGLLLLVQIARGERFAPQDAEDVDVDAPVSWRALGTAIAASAVPIFTMRRLGFPVTAALSFALVARAFGSATLLRDLAIGLAIGLICWYGFSELLGIGLPLAPVLLDR
ncbi:MAG TPA: tripartite tricarboxylate transporter TctB family protein [Thermodesulfobacteriota bacterium]